MSKKNLQERLQTASRKWGLTQMEGIYVKENCAVFGADSAKYGSHLKAERDINFAWSLAPEYSF